VTLGIFYCELESEVGKMVSVEAKIDGKRVILRPREMIVQATGFSANKDCLFIPAFAAVKLGDEVLDFQVEEGSDIIFWAVLVRGPQGHEVCVIKLDWQAGRVGLAGVFSVPGRPERIRFLLQESSKDSAKFEFFLLDSRKNLTIVARELHWNPKKSPFPPTTVELATLSFDHIGQFTCFDLWENQDGNEVHLVLGGKNGTVLHNLWQRCKGVQLLETWNDHANFNVSCVKIFPVRVGPALNTGEAGGLHPSLLVAAATGDGDIKIFRSGDPTSLIQIQFQNRPLSCLAVDPSLSLIYVLDETDPSLLTITNFFRNSDLSKGSDALKRNIKFERNLTYAAFNFSGDTFAAVCDGCSIKTLSLKVASPEPQGNYF
jgi:hypothetical protein